MKVREVCEAMAAGGTQSGERRGGGGMREEAFARVPLAAIHDQRLSHRQLRVLLALLSFRTQPADTVWPTRAALAARCGLLVNRISQITTALCKLGWLVKVGKGGRSTSCRYRIMDTPMTGAETLPDLATVTTKTLPDSGRDRSIETLPDLATVTEMETVTDSVRGKEQRLEATHKPPLLMSSKPNAGRNEAPDIKKSAIENAEAQEVIAYLNAKTGRSYRLVASNLRLVQARLREGATAAQLKGVINAKVRQWGHDAKMAAYLRPETLFGATKFEQYLGQLTVQGTGFVEHDARFVN